MTQSKIKVLFGSQMKYTGFGRKGCSHSMYGGGFNFYVYGIKGLFGITKYVSWGKCWNDNN